MIIIIVMENLDIKMMKNREKQQKQKQKKKFFIEMTPMKQKKKCGQYKYMNDQNL